MRIGVDIDGVLNNIAEWHFNFGMKFALEEGIYKGFNPTEYYMEQEFFFNKEENVKFWQRYIFDLLMAIPIRPFAREVLHKLRKEGHTIVILTARDNQYLTNQYEGKMNFYICEWLAKNNIEYDEIITGSTNKCDKCLNHKIDIMIEDKKTNVKKLSEHIPVLCFDAPYNRDISGENITRVYTWYEIYQYFQKYKKPVIEKLDVI